MKSLNQVTMMLAIKLAETERKLERAPERRQPWGKISTNECKNYKLGCSSEIKELLELTLNKVTVLEAQS